MARFAFWGLIIVVALAPLPFGSNRPAPWSLLAIAVGGLLVAWAIAVIRNPRRILLPWSLHWPITVGFLLVLAWLYVQMATWTPAAWHNPLWTDASAALSQSLSGAISISPAQGVTAIMRLITYGGVFWLAMHFGADRRRARIALWSIVLAGVAYALYGIATELASDQTILWYRKWAYVDSLTSTFVNRNSFASYAGISLLVALALLDSRLRRSTQSPAGSIADMAESYARDGGPLFVCILILGAALLLSHSRGGLLAIFVGLIAFVLSEIVQRNRTRNIRRVAVAICLTTGLLIVVGGGATLQRFAPANSEGLEDRPKIYAQTIEGIGQTPWVGIGYGNFESAFNLWGGARDMSLARVDKAHNSYLEFAAEAGLPALGVVLIVLVWIVARCARGILVRRRDVIFPQCALTVSASLGAHSLYDFSIQIPAVAVAFCLVLGIGYAQAQSLSGIEVGEGTGVPYGPADRSA
jgi:O-antigen ligase